MRTKREVLLWDNDGVPALWIHHLPNGALCLDDQNCCPGVPIKRTDLPRLIREWKTVVEWDSESESD